MPVTPKKPAPKPNADRSKAARIRAKKTAGKATEAELAWLARYESAQAAPEPAKSPPATGEPVSPDVVFKTQPRGAGGAERWVAVPLLPPSSGAAPDGAPPPPGSPPPPAPGTPFVDPPPKAPPAAEQVESNAKKFATFLRGVNAFGLGALKQMIPWRELGIPAEYIALFEGDEGLKLALDYIEACAEQVGRDHPLIAAIGPNPAAVVIGSTAVSCGGLYVRYVMPLRAAAEEQKAAAAGAPPPRGAAPPPRRSPPPRGAPPPGPPPPASPAPSSAPDPDAVRRWLVQLHAAGETPS